MFFQPSTSSFWAWFYWRCFDWTYCFIWKNFGFTSCIHQPWQNDFQLAKTRRPTSSSNLPNCRTLTNFKSRSFLSRSDFKLYRNFYCKRSKRRFCYVLITGNVFEQLQSDDKWKFGSIFKILRLSWSQSLKSKSIK